MFNCPIIFASTMELPSVFYYLIGETGHPILIPDSITPFYGKLDFKDRHKSNSFGVKPLGPAVVNVGGHRADLSSQPIPPEVKRFLDNATEGCIYLSLGSNVKSSLLSQRLSKELFQAIREIPYKVLWKFEKDLGEFPENIKTAKWLPQQKILNHPNVKVFLFQGGLQSMEEGVYGEVAFVVIPFFSDQHHNAGILKNKGAGIVLDKATLKKDELKAALVEVMTNSKYRNAVKKLKRLVLDEPMKGVDKAVWWTEYVIRHKGAKHLRNPAADLPLYQYYLLDVIGFLSLVALLTTLIVAVTLKKLCKLISRQIKLQIKETLIDSQILVFRLVPIVFLCVAVVQYVWNFMY